MRAVVIGGGVVGMFVAYFLLKAGYKVVIVDRNVEGEGASVYNAGIVTPSFTATPHIKFFDFVQWLTGLSKPITVSLGEVMRNMRWFFNAVRGGIGGADRIIMDLARRSLDLYKEFLKNESFDVDLTTGVLGLYRKLEDAETDSMSLGGELIAADTLVEWGYRSLGGGVLFRDDIALNPEKLFRCLRSRLSEMGASILLGVDGHFLIEEKRCAGLVIDGERLQGDVYVVATGSWSRQLCKPLGFDPMVLPARGFSMLFSTSGQRIVERPALLEDYGVGISQHGRETLKVTGFFELVGFNKTFGASRREWLLKVITRHLSNQQNLQLVKVGGGFRPCTPDQLPIVGAIPGYDDVSIATGHCRLGLTLAPITGYLLEAMISKKRIETDASSLSPSRFQKSKWK